MPQRSGHGKTGGGAFQAHKADAFMRNSFFASTAATAVLASGLMGQPALGNQPTGTFNALGTQSPSGPACASSNPYPGPAGTFPFLLTDGTVMVHDQGGTAQNWWRLTPDNTGSYSCGTWTKLASIPNSFGYGPRYYASAVLADGRLAIAGGEYNLGGPRSEIAKGAIYLPTTNQWLPIRPPAGWTSIGDAQSAVLPNGQWMISNSQTQQQALFNENNLTFTPTGYGFKICTNGETGWTLLPDGSLFSVDDNISCGTSPSAERWVNGTWFVASSKGNAPQQLFDSASELGPQILMYDGTVLVIGATGLISIYTPPPVQTPPSFQTGS